MFSTISSKDFQYIVLFGEFNELGSFKSTSSYDWELIEEGMACFHYSTQIMVFADQSTSMAEYPPGQLLRELLPECSRRGMVRVFSRDAPIWEELGVVFC